MSLTPPLTAAPARPSQVDRAVGYALLVLWLVWTWGAFQGAWANDLAALWFAGHFHASGQPELIYAAPPLFFGGTPPAWEGLHATLGLAPDQLAYPYIYPPLWAGLAAPLTRALAPQAFFDLVLTVHLAMIAGSILLAERLARPAFLPFAGFIIWALLVLTQTAPGFALLSLNQPTITVSFFTLLAIWLIRRAPAGAGAVLALAAAIKLTPILFAALFVQARRPRAIVAMVLTGGALALTSVALMGWPLHRAFLAQLDLASDKSVWGMVNPSLRILMLDVASQFGLAEPLTQGAGSVTVLIMPRWTGLLAALLALGIALPVALAARKRHSAHALTLVALGLSVALFLFGPLSWLHYLELPLLLLPALGFGLGRAPTLALLAAMAALNSSELLLRLGPLQQGLAIYGWSMVLGWSTALAATFVALIRQPRGE
ncbi:glycosyltransferase family 87 protein [Sinirhodobacter sp. HNIBRBA609]|nr:glycosyltransferase family 87 protein [Sinirhodobacter sp. HNIBRBA609]